MKKLAWLLLGFYSTIALADVTGLVAPPGGSGGGGSMTWPGTAGIPCYSGASSWCTSYGTTGSGTNLVLATSPTLITPVFQDSVGNPASSGEYWGWNGTRQGWFTPSGSGVTLQTNGTNNASQTTLNLVGTGGVAVTNPSGGTVDIGPVSEAVNAQTGTTYTVVSTDCGKQVTFNNASAVAVTVPQATSTFASCQFDVTNIGAGTATLTPTTSTINGASTLAVAQNRQCTVNSDGTNWQVIGCTALVSGGSSSTQIEASTVGFVTPSGTQYFVWMGSGGLGTETSSSVTAPRAGTIQDLYVHTGGSEGAAATIQITLRDNATSEAVTCTVGNSANSCSDTTHSFTFAQGDQLAWQTIQTGTGTGGSINVSFLVQ